MILGLTGADELPEHFDLVNLCPTPGYSQAVAGRLAPAMVTQLIAGRYRRVVLCGAGPAEAFGLPYVPHFKWYDHHTELQSHSAGMRVRRWTWKVAVIPHPSGTVLYWNSPENRAKGHRFLWEAVRLANMEAP